MIRSTCASALFIAAFIAIPATAQINLSGVWANKLHEDWPDRLPGPELGDYAGIPLSDAARLRAESWDASLITLPEYQCRVHPSDYASSFADIRIWEEIDEPTQQLKALHIHHFAWETERTIWMDGRPHPPEYALHTSMGFSTGKWEGDKLVVTTDHYKEGWIRRNGVPRSDRAVSTEYFIRHGNDMTWMVVIHDPTYLTDTFVRSRDYTFSAGGAIQPYPCESVVEVVRPRGTIPHHLPGTNTFLKEYQEAHHIPEEGAMGGAKTMFPEYRTRLAGLARK